MLSASLPASEAPGRVVAERDTKCFGPFYPRPDPVYLGTTINDKRVGHATGPEAGSGVGILLPAVFGVVSLLEQWGAAQNQAFEAEGTRKQELVAIDAETVPRALRVRGQLGGGMVGGEQCSELKSAAAQGLLGKVQWSQA